MVKVFIFIAVLLAIVVGAFRYFPQGKISELKSTAVSFNLSKKEPEIEKLTLEKIFSEHKQISGLDPEKVITIIVTGDVIPARSTNYQTATRKNWLWPFEKTAGVLKSADLTFINLETPLMRNCPLTQEGMIFCGDARHIEGLKSAGVDVANFGNNHASNHGRSGIDETKQLLESNGILVTGLNGAVYKEIKGVRFAFLGYNDISKNDIVSSADDEKIRTEVTEARKNADVVIVQYHWGTEYITEPEDRQKYLGRLTIDSGADLVIGNHPHWIKPIEFYKPSLPSPDGDDKSKLITYGHGNFVFDQEWSQKTKEGVVGKYTFYGPKLIDVEYLPVEIVNYGQPYFLEGEKKLKILDEMYRESLKLKPPA